jgi:excisionase family DNA binding protein
MEIRDTEEKILSEGLKMLARMVARTIIKENLLGEESLHVEDGSPHAEPIDDESPGEDYRRLVLSVPEAAKLLGLSTPTTYQAAKTGKIPNIRIGRRILIPRAALLKFLNEGSGDKGN